MHLHSSDELLLISATGVNLIQFVFYKNTDGCLGAQRNHTKHLNYIVANVYVLSCKQ